MDGLHVHVKRLQAQLAVSQCGFVAVLLCCAVVTLSPYMPCPSPHSEIGVQTVCREQDSGMGCVFLLATSYTCAGVLAVIL